MTNLNIQNDWTKNISNMQDKILVAKKVLQFVHDGDVIGFGSGSTCLLAVREIAKKVHADGLKIIAVPTSNEIESECMTLGITTIPSSEAKIDWGFDGADEVDKNGWLIKGLGGALYKEKKVIAKSPKTYILVDKSKFSKKLCTKCPVPIECSVEGYKQAMEGISKLGGKDITMRMKDAENFFVTENGNYIIDAFFDNVSSSLEQDLKKIYGVIETGLFIGYETEVLTNDI